jgi:hypothetical protein
MLNISWGEIGDKLHKIGAKLENYPNDTTKTISRMFYNLNMNA